jgi:hypothetical protein
VQSVAVCHFVVLSHKMYSTSGANDVVFILVCLKKIMITQCELVIKGGMLRVVNV